MSFLKAALSLAERGFHVFPVIPGGKKAAIKAYPEVATPDPGKITSWWIDPVMETEQPLNIGISTTHFSNTDKMCGLLVVDVDVKEGKLGAQSLLALELEGKELPPTCTQTTPTGGSHLIYWVKKAVKQGTDVLGPGLDIRSSGGYVLGAGSELEQGVYTISDDPVAEAPAWLVAACGEAKAPRPKTSTKKGLTAQGDLRISQKTAVKRAIDLIQEGLPVAIEGEGGDQATFYAACRLKDLGLDEEKTLELLADYWNPNCEPPWPVEELKLKVTNAYAYGQNEIGADAPERFFGPIKLDEPNHPDEELSPVEKLNREFAFILMGGSAHILWETTNAMGKPTVLHLTEHAFHQLLAAKTISFGNGRRKPLTEFWMESHERRTYKGIVFSPGRETPKDFYNLWRGFSVTPAATGEAPSARAAFALQRFLEHARDNVCNRNEELFKWLIGYFAHTIQKPWEKPLVSVVFRGKKGVGKNVLVKLLGHLIRDHYLVAANRRYLTGNFNSHLENLLVIVLDEAFWSGDKAAEGILKDLVTGDDHLIERKGMESYKVQNLTRVFILGNEDWVVPASEDERRYAVFDVAPHRKQDRVYFTELREAMEEGGYPLLLRFLMDYDLKDVDVNYAIPTEGLLHQKIESLHAIHQWIYSCLNEGKIPGVPFSDSWPEEVDREMLRSAFRHFTKERGIRTWSPSDQAFGKYLHQALPGIRTGRGKASEMGLRPWTYKFPDLATARKDWEIFIGHEMKWETEIDLPSVYT